VARPPRHRYTASAGIVPRPYRDLLVSTEPTTTVISLVPAGDRSHIVVSRSRPAHVGRRDIDLPRLWPGFHLYRGEQDFYASRGFTETYSLPGLPRSAARRRDRGSYSMWWLRKQLAARSTQMYEAVCTVGSIASVPFQQVPISVYCSTALSSAAALTPAGVASPVTGGTRHARRSPKASPSISCCAASRPASTKPASCASTAQAAFKSAGELRARRQRRLRDGAPTAARATRAAAKVASLAPMLGLGQTMQPSTSVVVQFPSRADQDRCAHCGARS